MPMETEAANTPDIPVGDLTLTFTRAEFETAFPGGPGDVYVRCGWWSEDVPPFPEAQYQIFDCTMEPAI